MKGTEIIVCANPHGTFEECIVGDTSKPGTTMMMQAGTNPQGGRFTYVASTVTTGNGRGKCILLKDTLQGKNYGDAYVSGTRGFLYWPLPGEDMNILMAGAAGTGSANAFKIGDLLAINSSGKGVANSGYTNPPYTCQEHIDEVPDVDTLVWVKAQ